jgi:HSP20 family molecular chaperone IbpA
MIVKGAEIQDGILTINIELELPEEKKPRVVDIVEIK